jgi:protein-disulfide isomerase
MEKTTTRRRRISRQQETKKKQSGITRMQIGLVAGIALLMVLTFIVLNRGGADGRAPAETAASSNVTAAQGVFAGINLDEIPSARTDEGDPVLGSPDAPVTIVEYSDYQCPHCASFAQNTLPEVIKSYIATGKVRHIHKNAAILGEESQWAAMAALCAADQDRFWQYHEHLFRKQSGRNEGAFSRDNLKQFAADLGLDTTAFNQCLDENKYSQTVVEETEAGKQRGVEGTPSFFVNDELIPGNVPFDQMKAIIDKHLEGQS